MYTCIRETNALKSSSPLWSEWQDASGGLKPNYLWQVHSSGSPTRKNHIPCHQPTSVIVPMWKAPPFFFDKITQGKIRFS